MNTFLDFSGYIDNEEAVFKYGVVDFIVTKIEDKISQNGNEMKVLLLEVKDSAGTVRITKHYLTMVDKGMFFVREFCRAAGLYNEFKKRSLSDASFLNGKGRCVTIKDEYTDQQTQRLMESVKIIQFIENPILNQKEMTNDNLEASSVTHDNFEDKDISF